MHACRPNRLFLALLFALLAPAALIAADWGNLKVKFVVDGKPAAPEKLNVDKDQAVCGKGMLVDESLVVGAGGELMNVALYLRTDGAAIHPDYEKSLAEKVVLDNNTCRFEPHMAFVRVGQKFEIKNSDPVGHNSNVHCLKNPGMNPLIPANGAVDTVFKQEEILPMNVDCNIHGWMQAKVLIRKSPYAGVSGKDGAIEIKNIPAGTELEFQLWHERQGNLKDVQMQGAKADTKGRFKFKLKSGDNDLGTVKVPAKQLTKK